MPLALAWISLLSALNGPPPPGPLAWSPDGRWVAYVQEVRPAARGAAPGWLLRQEDVPPLAPADPGVPPTAYRLWATRPDTGESALLDEGTGPISAPAWSRDGTHLAYGRVARSSDGASAWEVVVQDTPERRRVVHREPIAGAEPPASKLRGLRPSWSPDGLMLALPRLAPAGVVIARVEGGRPVRGLDGASRPEWAPTENRLAFVGSGAKGGIWVLDGIRAEPRAVAPPSALDDLLPAPIWTPDGRFLLTLRRSSTGVPMGGSPLAAGPGLELMRYRADDSQIERPVGLTHDPIGGDADLVGVWFATDPDQENAFYATAARGQTSSQMTWSVGRFDVVKKRLNPFDETVLLGGMAVPHERRGVALRIGVDGSWSAPAVCDPETEGLRLLAPDEAARADWLARIVATLWPILRERVPPATLADGREVDRPTPLPAPGELESGDSVAFRMTRLAKLGLPLLGPESPETDELRLMLAYLAGDARQAGSVADRLLDRATTTEDRAALRAVRAQTLLMARDFNRARPLIEHLQALDRSAPSRVVEDVLEGHRFAPPGPSRAGWPSFLAERMKALKSPPADESPDLVPRELLDLDENRRPAAVPF